MACLIGPHPFCVIHGSSVALSVGKVCAWIKLPSCPVLGCWQWFPWWLMNAFSLSHYLLFTGFAGMCGCAWFLELCSCVQVQSHSARALSQTTSASFPDHLCLIPRFEFCFTTVLLWCCYTPITCVLLLCIGSWVPCLNHVGSKLYFCCWRVLRPVTLEVQTLSLHNSGWQQVFQSKFGGFHNCLIKVANVIQFEWHATLPIPIPFQEGQYERVENLLSQYHSAVNARCHMTGDTPLIAAARNGHRKVG